MHEKKFRATTRCSTFVVYMLRINFIKIMASRERFELPWVAPPVFKTGALPG